MFVMYPLWKLCRHCLKLSILYQIFNRHISIPSAPVESESEEFFLTHASNASCAHKCTSKYSFFPHTITLWNQLPVTVAVMCFIKHF